MIFIYPLKNYNGDGFNDFYFGEIIQPSSWFYTTCGFLQSGTMMKPILLVFIILIAACQETNLTGIDKYAPPTEDTSLAPEELVVTMNQKSLKSVPTESTQRFNSTNEECKWNRPSFNTPPLLNGV